MTGVLVMGVSLSSASARPGAIGRPLVTRPECQTKINYTLDNPPFWVLVMNFEVMQNSQPVGCLLLFEQAAGIPRQVSLTGCSTIGAVAIAHGAGIFDGGHVECVLSMSALLGISASNIYTTYSVFGMGTISPSLDATHPFGNPIGFYRSNQPGADLGLLLPALLTAPTHSMLGMKGTLQPASLLPVFASADGLQAQYWGIIFNGYKFPGAPIGEAIAQYVLDGYTVDARPGNALTYTFRADGGTFYVGGSPLGPGLHGTLDEVIIDPQNGGSPDLLPELGPPQPRRSFLPEVTR